jgi:nucleoside-diphosphate-sugar epimerase
MATLGPKGTLRLMRLESGLPTSDLEYILTKTRPLWEEFRGASIFITGGTGFFGKWILGSLAYANRELGLNARALVLTRTARPADDSIEFLQGDVRTFDFPKGPFTHVIHAATPASAALLAENPAEISEIILDGTKRVLEFTAKSGAKKLLFTSSGAVYGRQPSELSHVPETFDGAPDPLDPSSAYGIGKREAEKLSILYGKENGFEAKIARCFAFVGPHLPLDIHYAIGNFIRDGLLGSTIKVGGDGTPYRSYLYASELAVWLWTIMARGRPSDAYNVGSEEALSVADLAHRVADYFGTKAEIARQPAPGAAATHYIPSTRKAQAELGLDCTVNLAQAIDKTATYFRLDPRYKHG